MQKNQQNTQRYEEEEIDLKELFKTLMKNKMKIALITSIITIGAVLYAYTAPKRYEAKAVVSVGSIKYSNNGNGNFTLENPNNLVKRLQIKYIENSPKNISLVRNTEGLVEIVVNSSSNKEAKKRLDEIVTALQEDHKKIINDYRALIVANIENLKSQKKELEDGKIKFEGSKQIEYELLSKINDLNLQISPLNINETKLLGNITTNNYSIQPKKKLIVTVAFVTGLILSIFFVFFMEFINSNRKEVKE
ncbi:Wzz/FepE/Etk N-terminal domain-containing protein [Sulfurimonas sp.]|uniref:Wzz/FepE/Etk N-terminal domain-containing protein n=1 Tax=Sulfurimonas sp. TaxID=2022749 RepID=UPI00356804AF